MNKLELVKKIQEEAGLKKEDAQKVIEIFFGSITEALADGKRVEIRGFCSFYVKEYKSYVGRNPKTGENVKVNRSYAVAPKVQAGCSIYFLTAFLIILYLSSKQLRPVLKLQTEKRKNVLIASPI